MFSRDDIQYIPIGFSFLDCGYMREIGMGPMWVYVALRRNAWRSDKGELGKHWLGGKIVSRIGHEGVAERLDIGKMSVKRYLDVLYKKGWVKRLDERTGRALVYVLGSVIETAEGPVESFFADVLTARKVAEWKAKNEKEQGRGAKLIHQGDQIDLSEGSNRSTEYRTGNREEPIENFVPSPSAPGHTAQPGNRPADEVKALPVSEHGGGTPEMPQDASGVGGGGDRALEGPKASAAGQPSASPSILEVPSTPKEGGGGGEGENNVLKAHTVCAGAGQKVMPWEVEEEEGGRKPKKPRKRGLYDPAKSVSEWNGNDLVGYFRVRFKAMWPGEGAPDVRIEDLAAAKRRIVWMKDEKMDMCLAKRAIDHLFANWSDGLPGRLRWKGSRPGIAIIENARLFEMLVREVQNGTGGAAKVDDWKGETPEVKRYQERETIRARLLNEGATLEQATREANRLAGL
jgi:hypothetical protein